MSKCRLSEALKRQLVITCNLYLSINTQNILEEGEVSEGLC